MKLEQQLYSHTWYSVIQGVEYLDLEYDLEEVPWDLLEKPLLFLVSCSLDYDIWKVI